MDLPDKPIIEASLANVVSTTRSTCLRNVAMVEHVLAALRGMEVDNCHIEVDGPEVPMLDGSALPYCEKIENNIVEQPEQERFYLKMGSQFATDLKIIVHVDFTYWSRAIGIQHAYMNSIKHFKQEIAPARTFALLDEIDELRKQGILLGDVGPQNAIVFKKDQIDNLPSLRFPNEIARHKLLDVIGDLALLPNPIKGSLMFDKPGHTSNIAWAKKVMLSTSTSTTTTTTSNTSQLS